MSEPRHAEVSGLLSSVRRALQVLEVVAEVGDGITAKAVARRLGFKLPTTYHLLGSLVAEGYLVYRDDLRGYGVGYKIAQLHEALRTQLEVPPPLAAIVRDVHEVCGAAAYYTVFRDSEVVVAHVEDCVDHPRARPLAVGFHEACHATAFGKVMLASLGPGQLAERLCRDGLPQLTPRTLAAASDLGRELERVRKAGAAVEIEEFQPGLASVAAPVRDGGGRVTGALAVSVPAAEFGSRRWRLERAVRQGAGRASRTLALAGVGSA